MASDLGLQCFPMTLLQVSRLEWFKILKDLQVVFLFFGICVVMVYVSEKLNGYISNNSIDVIGNGWKNKIQNEGHYNYQPLLLHKTPGGKLEGSTYKFSKNWYYRNMLKYWDT